MGLFLIGEGILNGGDVNYIWKPEFIYSFHKYLLYTAFSFLGGLLMLRELGGEEKLTWVICKIKRSAKFCS